MIGRTYKLPSGRLVRVLELLRDQRGHVLACAYVPSLGAPAPTDADLMLRRTWLIEYGWRLYGERTVQRQSKDA
ncbi:MAG: hypothetical protein N2688_01785 [Burkholderiaceae bacterium]|nr:hypothetical protein [Burkholderiaceae bacterium]